MLKMLTRSLIFSLLFIVACQKSDSPAGLPQQAKSNSDIENLSGPDKGRSCAANEVLQAQLANNPSLRKKMADIETFSKNAVANGRINTRGTLEIPVVVHVIWNTTEENISDAQIASQMDVLNEDFNLRNKDHRLAPSIFSDLKGDLAISFKLLKTERVKTKLASWQITDGMKYTKRGGSDAVDPTHVLNIWVVDLAGYLGYAQFPGGDPATDGIVVDFFAFGRIGNLYRDYNLGRTATHEVGHWLNLRHIWGDATCGNDFVGDTPTAHRANFGCPELQDACEPGKKEMTMNYMDYTDDRCMYMFTIGQKKERVDPLFIAGGSRESFTQ